MKTPVELVRELYDAFAFKDADRLRAILAPDVEWIQCAGFPGGDHRHGAEQVIEKVFGGLHSVWRDFAAPVEEYLLAAGDAGDTVVALGRYEGTHSTTGRSMTSVFAHIYDVHDGRIVRFRQVADTWPMVAAMQDTQDS